MRRYLLLVDLGHARADHGEFHPLAQEIKIIGVQLQLNEVRCEQRPARRDHEHVGQVAHGDVQHILSVAPRPGGHPLYPRMIPGDAQRPQGAHDRGGKDRDHHQHHGGGDGRARHHVQDQPARRDAARDRPALPAPPPQRSAPRPTRRVPASRHRAPSLTCCYSSERLIRQSSRPRMRSRSAVSQRIADSFQISGSCRRERPLPGFWKTLGYSCALDPVSPCAGMLPPRLQKR